jgi:hypothetical protein
MWRLISAFGKVWKGNTAKQKNKKSTFKAGMYMKTKETQTICPKKVGHFCLSFGHFRLTNTSFTEIPGELSAKRRHLLTKALLASSLACGFDGGRGPMLARAALTKCLLKYTVFTRIFAHMSLSNRSDSRRRQADGENAGLRLSTGDADGEPADSMESPRRADG